MVGMFFTAAVWQEEQYVCEPDKHLQIIRCEARSLIFQKSTPYDKHALKMIECDVVYFETGWDTD